jgi:GT2 family glycosyltransferase
MTVPRVGAVVIGRNEGERFRRCLESLLGAADPVVYVDSGSTDGSIEHAKSLGVPVVELDTSIPFTAARARNAGFERLCALAPALELVMFVDGDCEVAQGWWSDACGFLDENEAYGVVCGRRKERHPNASIYNYLCDVEWNTPIGDAKACGGDALMRTEAFAEVGGFNPSLIAGEEPELCVRLRAKGWKIRRIDSDMTLHDAAMTRFSQWWQRAKRAGHAYAEGSALHGAPPERHWVKETRSIVVWGLGLPAVSILGAPLSGGLSLGLLALFPLNALRVGRRLRRDGIERPWVVAAFMMMSKLPGAAGWIRFQRGRLSGRRSALIEYKQT